MRSARHQNTGCGTPEHWMRDTRKKSICIYCKRLYYFYYLCGSKHEIMENYKLMNVASGRVFEDQGWTLDDPQGEQPSLVRAVYEQKQLRVGDDRLGLYKYADWMPIQRTLENPSCPVTYKSEKLAKRLGLNNLYITFSGWWPAKGAKMTTCSFKETEAYSVCARLGEEQKDKVLVVASAGNTARAFAKVCSDNGIPLLLCVPQDNLNALWFDKPPCGGWRCR